MPPNFLESGNAPLARGEARPVQRLGIVLGNAKTRGVHVREHVLGVVLPLSLSFDHRVVTGGEAARFLVALVADLARPTS